MSIARNILHALAPAIQALHDDGVYVQHKFVKNINEQLKAAGFKLEYVMSSNGMIVVCETKP